jgi:hypothetical protein
MEGKSALRLSFFLLLLGNLAFHVWSAGYLSAGRVGYEPERLAQQLHPERVVIVAQSKPKNDNKSLTSDNGTIGCSRLSGFSGNDGRLIEAALAATEGITLSRQMLPASTVYWVLIPGLPNRQFADKKIAELRQLGIIDARVAEDDVSGPLVAFFGAFASEKEAQEHLNALARKGVRSARLTLRQLPEQLSTLDIRASAEVLKRLPGTLAPYPGLVFGECTPVAVSQPSS